MSQRFSVSLFERWSFVLSPALPNGGFTFTLTIDNTSVGPAQVMALADDNPLPMV